MIYQCLLFVLFGIFYDTYAITINEYHQQELLQQHEHLPEGQNKYSPPIPILQQDFHLDPHGYKFSYKTGNGIEAEEIGTIKNKGVKDHETIVQQGKVTYHDEHGKPITLVYIADEHGFQPQGNHLPTPPPLPPILEKAFAEHAQAYAQEEAFHKKYAHDNQEFESDYQQQYEQQAPINEHVVEEQEQVHDEQPHYATQER
ncbi:endocuticle structural glycoprotein SgAbd-8-like [Agrilus planipennis]|uniref:Endocuticle structural glycoprotein SgAbd-8-like n=1 Tax=Agrilus planipennis TaxID=224129 RepID=A0A1W4XDG9_AGRPL|nr:endocuticle structural glycoprotein SgAbd-8-like [Agrilus planipennis]